MRKRAAPSTLAEWITEGTRFLESANIADARRNVEWMLCELFGTGRAGLFARSDRVLGIDEAAAFRKMLGRRAGREPLQYILGHTSFCGLRIGVSPAVLIPRPETEELVQLGLAALSGVGAPRVLDIGTGSGCIALAVKHARPDACVSAGDVSADALRQARENAATLGLDVAFFSFDILRDTAIPGSATGFDLILSNPPYVPIEDRLSLESEVADFEPHMALFAGPNPLVFYEAITRLASTALSAGGAAIVEVYAPYADRVAAVFREAAFADVRVIADLTGRSRFVSVRSSGNPAGSTASARLLHL
jgi:release factor glutamine methyltransferase